MNNYFFRILWNNDIIFKDLGDSITANDLAKIQIKNEIGVFQDSIHRVDFGDEAALSDILDAVYEGTGADLKGNSLGVTYQHGVKYYNERLANAPFHEIIANYTQLKLTGKNSSIKILKNTFGEDFVNTLENVFQQFKA